MEHQRNLFEEEKTTSLAARYPYQYPTIPFFLDIVCACVGFCRIFYSLIAWVGSWRFHMHWNQERIISTRGRPGNLLSCWNAFICILVDPCMSLYFKGHAWYNSYRAIRKRKRKSQTPKRPKKLVEGGGTSHKFGWGELLGHKKTLSRYQTRKFQFGDPTV